ncbi:hypothetical protein ACLOJK_001253 [Asimina triloba]
MRNPSPSVPQHNERSLSHNAVTARPLHTSDAPLPEYRVSSNSSDPSGESPNNSVTRAEFHVLLEMMKSLK